MYGTFPSVSVSEKENNSQRNLERWIYQMWQASMTYTHTYIHMCTHTHTQIYGIDSSYSIQCLSMKCIFH